ncbi:YkuS family protein [Haloimpatiens sp. FM7330]|uniref:YkuS family protein n=1 Tax=Haloimpatiens sp. FM7330 TaxID=3298610 RepID=UPI00364447FA
MKKRVAVEKGLRPVKQFLSEDGYKVSEFTSKEMNDSAYFNKFDAVIITGEDENMMGMEDAITEVPVISAHGMTPEEVKSQMENKMM